MGYNYDAKTGQSLSLRDILSDYDLFCDEMIETLEYINENDEEYKNSFDEGWEDILRDELSEDYYEWNLTDKGIDIWFYVPKAGQIGFSIYTSDDPEIFSPNYLPGGKNPGVAESSLEASYLYMDVAIPVSEQHGSMSFEDALELLQSDSVLEDNNKYELHVNNPWVSEDCGNIIVTETESGNELYIFFAPLDPTEVGGEVVVEDVWYRSEDLCVVLGRDRANFNAEKYKCELIDYEIHKSFSIDNAKDAGNVIRHMLQK